MTLNIDQATADGLVLDGLLGAYAAAVDNRDWQQWLSLFTNDCAYAVYTLENVERGLPLGYMLDDCRERLVDRIKFVTDVWAKTVEPYRTRHIIQRVQTERGADGTYKVRSNLLVSYTETDAPPAMLASGYYEDVIRLTEDGPRFVEKTVYLDGTPARYLVYPL